MQKKRIEQARRAEARDARLNARDREIVRRVRAGDNTADIARDHKITRARVSQIARDAGVDPRPHALHHPRVSRGHPLSYVALLREAVGWTQDELAPRGRFTYHRPARRARGHERHYMGAAARRTGGPMRTWTFEELRMDRVAMRDRAARTARAARGQWDMNDERWASLARARELIRANRSMTRDEVEEVAVWGLLSYMDGTVLEIADEFPAPVVRAAVKRDREYSRVMRTVRGLAALMLALVGIACGDASDPVPSGPIVLSVEVRPTDPVHTCMYRFTADAGDLTDRATWLDADMRVTRGNDLAINATYWLPSRGIEPGEILTGPWRGQGASGAWSAVVVWRYKTAGRTDSASVSFDCDW